MCVTCGCGKLEDQHGDERNITLSQFRAAASAAGIDLTRLTSNETGLRLRSPATDALVTNMESMNEPLPSGQFAAKLESTPYTE